MQETDLHDLSDDADYAASQLQGSASMMGSDSRTQSSSSEPDGAEIVYMKDNVTIHPTQFASERISGRLKLIKQGYTLFMTWIPYKGQSSNAKLSEKDRNLYTIRAVPFTEVRSIRRHTPALGWQYIIVVLSSGLAYPPLYFYNGGVKEFLGSIKQHVFIVRSAEDANVFLVNDFQNPLQKTLSSLELPRAVSVVSEPSMSVSVGESPLNDNQEITDAGVRSETSSVSQYNVKQRQKGHDPARDLSIQVLEKFSLVTKFARETTSQIFRESHGNGFGAIERRSHNHSALDSAQKASNIAEKVPDTIPVASDPLEVDKLTLVWGKPRQPPLGPEEWFTFLDSEGRVMDSKALRKRIFYGGLEHGLRKEAWAFVLGYHLYDSTYAERQYLRLIKKSEYETIKRQWQSISSEQAKRFTKFRERKGLIEKDVVRTDRSLSFYDGEDNANVNLLRDILLTYSFYNFDLGYCQGMSDLLSPILFVMEDESESFWCFVALMERLGPNFNRDQNGMHSQLFALSKLVELLDSPLHNYFEQNDCLNYFFCFRWILIQLKREFEYEKTMRLWEVLWTHYLSEHFHLYVCVAILKRYRNRIMGEQMDFDTLLKFINELSGHIDLDSVLRDAEALCICAGENGAACIPPGTPPSLPVEDGLLYTEQDDVL
ncbi:TBC1 domain family member 15-like isoform X2 [Juglans microcarpa x Juglans regia]|uniref:TBC1 domain family member 15-like isoform X2 n=1 Tax=Juglans microcarpa x Juglans regia TaxID=2249226 RepID=UPI001B7F4E65|nr:TBC1 domain family member 15-like isoform X2 [Juglans microcarpa x Juglans regia]